MLDHLSLFPATKEQAVESRLRSYESWGRPYGVPIEGYLDRKNTMAGLEMAAEGRWTSWVLAPRDDPETLDFMCSCETLRREVIVYQKDNSDSTDLRKEEKIGYGVASVYTPPKNRGKGYARHMMRLLHWVIASPSAFPSPFPEAWGKAPAVPEGLGQGVVSVLYSDVGSQFYKACGPCPGADGWVAAPHIITTWSMETTLQESGPASTQDKWRLVGKDKLKEIIDGDSELIVEEAPTLESPDAQTAFTFLPRKGLAEYLYRKIDWYLDQMTDPPQQWGIESTAGYPGRNDFAIWTFELLPNSPKTLLITRLRCQKDALSEMGADCCLCQGNRD